MKHKEYELQKQVCAYLEKQYPHVLFYSDTIANVKLNVMQGARNKAIQKSGFKMPDLIILHPNKHSHGLCIELKIESPFKKNGELKSSEHLKGQHEAIVKLNSLGYDSWFCWTFEQAKEMIDFYMKHC